VPVACLTACLLSCSNMDQKWTVMRSLLVVTPIAVIMGGIQAALVVAFRIAKSRHLEWPLTFMAVLSAALLAAGVLRHYWDIWIHRTVRGISFIFVGIDALGDVFSMASVFFQPTIDVLGIVIYGTELILWIGVFACGGYYNFLPWIRKKWLSRESQDHRSVELECRSTASGESVRDIGITAHENISSTSVFRTASREIAGFRPRIVTSIRSNSDELQA
jgi:hypothetical protein